MKKLIRNSSILAFFTILLFYWQNIFADNILNIFTPKPITDGTDKSILLLGQMFGGVDGVLHGYGTQVLGAMFGIYNAAVIGVGGIIILYTIVVSTMNTAHEGEYLGRKWSTMWIPLRSALGTALLIPKASGYSIIQIFIMWVIIQGVGAADTLWKTTLEYIISTGTIMPTQITSSNVTSITNMAGQILKQNICLAGVSYFLQKHNAIDITLRPSIPKLGSQGRTYYLDFPSDQQITTLKNRKHNAVDFTTVPNVIKGGYVCGQMTFPKNNDTTLNDAQISAVQQMILDTEPFADDLIKNINSMTNSNGIIDQKEPENVLRNASLDYIAILDPSIHRANSIIDQNINQRLQGSLSDGWITAGRYYQQLAGLNNSRASIGNMVLTSTSFNPSSYGDAVFGSNSIWVAINTVMSMITDGITRNATNLVSQIPPSNLAVHLGFPGASGMGDVDTVINIFTFGMVGIAEGYWSSGFEHDNVDPVVAVVYLGNKLINQVAWMWIEIAAFVFGITLVTSMFPCTKAISDAINTTLLWIIPLCAMLMGLLFTAGAVMAYYVPLIPYIVFLFGSLGWILGVIESMVAAPLVALGVIHPDGGHEVYGKAEPAIMLIVNIFLRPSLMIIGFIAGILLSYVGLKLLNLGFGPAVANMARNGANGWSDGFKAIAIVVIYTFIVVMVINKAFTLITEIPNKVLRWIGGQEQLGDSQAPLQEIQGAVSGTAGKVGQTTADLSSETAKGAMDAGGQMGDNLSNWWKGAKQGPKGGLNIGE